MELKKAAGDMPHSLEAEQALLGCLLLDTKIQLEIASDLKEEDFYAESHKYIFSAMDMLIKSNQPVDLVTLTDALDATKYDKVCFYVYNGSDSDKGLFVRFDGGSYNPAFLTLKSGWNKVEMTVEQFNTLNILGIGSVSQTSAVYKFSDIYAVKKTSAG